MQIRAWQTDNVLTFDFLIEDHDCPDITVPKSGQVLARFLGGECRYFMPDHWRLDAVHPDLLAAAVLAIGHNRAARRWKLPRPVSAAFVERVQPLFRGAIEPVDPYLKPREAPPAHRVGLCFSAGVDSTAAMALLPANSVLAFSHRIRRPRQPERRTLYSPDAALNAISTLSQAGREAMIFPTDVEWIREPSGFMNDGAMSVPLSYMELVENYSRATPLKSACIVA